MDIGVEESFLLLCVYPPEADGDGGSSKSKSLLKNEKKSYIVQFFVH